MTKSAAVRKVVDEDEGGTDLAAVIADYERQQAQNSMFRPQGPGTFYIRILPPKKSGLYFRQFGVHYGLELVSPKFADYRGGVGCYKETLKEDCPICELQKRLYFQGKTQGDTTAGNLASEIRAKIRRVVNMIDMKNPSAGVRTWEYPASDNPERVSVATKISGLFAEWKKDITRPDERGGIIKITFEKKEKFLTCEDVQLTAKTDPVPKEIDWKAELHDLEAYAQARIIPLEKLQAMLEEAQPEETPAPRRRVTSTFTEDDGETSEEIEEVAGADEENEAEGESADTEQADDNIDEDDPNVARILEKLRKAGRVKA